MRLRSASAAAFVLFSAVAVGITPGCSDDATGSADADLKACKEAKLDAKGVCRAPNGTFAKATCCEKAWTCDALDTWSTDTCLADIDGTVNWDYCMSTTPAGDLRELSQRCCDEGEWAWCESSQPPAGFGADCTKSGCDEGFQCVEVNDDCSAVDCSGLEDCALRQTSLCSSTCQADDDCAKLAKAAGALAPEKAVCGSGAEKVCFLEGAELPDAQWTCTASVND